MTKSTKTTTTPVGKTKDPDVPASIAMLFGWNMEMAQFYFRRYQQYCTSPIEFMACKSVGEAQTQQAEFLQKLMEDYRENASRLSRIAHMDQPAKSADADYAAKLLKAQEDAANLIDQARAQAERILETARKRAAAMVPDAQAAAAEPEKKSA